MSNEPQKPGYGYFYVCIAISLGAFYGQQPIAGAIFMFLAGFNVGTSLEGQKTCELEQRLKAYAADWQERKGL